MIKVVSVIQRKPGTTVEAFQQYWRHQHAAIVSRLPGLRRYVQSHTLLAGYRKSVPAADGIAELWFDDLAAMQALKGSAALTAVLADEPAFIDPTTHVQTLTTEHVIKNGAVPHDGVKNIEFVTKKAGMAVADFQRHWITVHGPLGASIKPVQRYVQSHTRSGAYGKATAPVYDGFALTWFEHTDAMRASALSPEYAATRADEENFLTLPIDFIITREHIIIG